METDWLRPMSLGRILDRTFSLYRRYFLLLVGITAPQAALVATVGLVTNRLSMSQRAALSASGAPPDPVALMKVYATFWPVLLLLFLVSWIVGIIAHGAATTAVSRVYLGKPTGAVDSFSRLKGRIGRLILVSLGIVIRILGFALLLGMGIGVLAGVGFSINRVAGTVLLFVSVVGTIVVMIFILLRYLVAVPALIVEDSTAGQAISRSVTLMRGHRLRAVVILILMGVISYAALMLFQGPFIVFNVVATIRHSAPAPWILAGMALGQAVSIGLTAPLVLVAFVLLYFDLRIRKEAFDLQFMMSSLDHPMPAQDTPSPA